ncbi:hypothetical protein O6H91_05G125000 [Diphasiastrum complanatum]|uniref:Uncharacterized protein n=1 Tax=Diphasiastrum complanatum TaxID=34168 RepID=A0ACC2DST7_DIPCM|nr:hypothetical protein O6H91_05G125000 [Diphasiastrum complanatum]
MARGGISRQKPRRDKANKTGGHSYHGGKTRRDSDARGGRGDRRGGDNRRNISRHMDSGNEDGSIGHLLPPSSYRGQVDPETLSYFSELSALIVEGGSVLDPTEKATLSVNALDETRGKELPLACHAGCSRVLENILVSCDVVHTLSFLNNCISDLPLMLLDPSASHVVQAAMRSISNALLHHDKHAVWFKTFETTFAKVCKAVGEKAAEVMCSRYGSHVLRDIISILSGVSVDMSSKEVTNKSRTQLEGRLTMKAVSKNFVQLKHQGFPELLKSLATTILEACREMAAQLCADSAAGPVLQAILKALSGEKEFVTLAIATIMGCWKGNAASEGKVLENAHIEAITEMMKDRSSSHLIEVILQIAPDPLYVEMFQRFFRHRLLPLSLHQCANFAVQSLIASARHQGQVNLVLDELEESFAPLIEERRAGVVSSILAACGRFRTRQREVCRALAHAINRDVSTLNVTVPRMLFLEDFASSRKTGSQWEPSFGKKMSVLGSAMLQMIFSFPQDCNQQFSTSFAALEADQVLATVKDVSGRHVLEAFILSSAPLKHKHRSISKLKGHFAELATHPVSSFTVEKCFSIADINLKEAITSELVSVEDNLTRSKHGPYLLKRFDVTGSVEAKAELQARHS